MDLTTLEAELARLRTECESLQSRGASSSAPALKAFELRGAAGAGAAPLPTQVLSALAAPKDDHAANVRAVEQAYARAIRLDPEDHLTRLNAAITLCNAGDSESAREMFEAHDQLWGALDEDGKVDAGEEVDEQRRALRDALYGSS